MRGIDINVIKNLTSPI